MASKPKVDPGFGDDTWLPVKKLLREEGLEIPREGEYQRVLKLDMVQLIADDFDARAFVRPVVVQRADGSYHVVDGYHRVEAASGLSLDRVPVVLHTGLSIAQEAALFIRLNRDRRTVSATQRFHGDCEAGDVGALALDKLLLSHGLDARCIERANTMPFRPIAPARRSLVVSGGLDLIDRTLKALSTAYRGDAEAFSKSPWFGDARVINGVIGFMHREPDASADEFRKIARDRFPTPDILRETAKKMNGKDGGGGGVGGIDELLSRELRKLRTALKAAA